MDKHSTRNSPKSSIESTQACPEELEALQGRMVILEQEKDQLKEQLELQNKKYKELEKRLTIHSLTGIPSHYTLNLELVDLVESYNKGTGKPFCLAILHLSHHFDIIKKTLKASVSEWVIYQVAKRIEEQVDLGDRVFHTKDNEFVMILFEKSGPDLQRFLSTLQHRVQEPHIFSGFNLTVKSHLGAALYPNHGSDKSQILHHADLALGAAMERGKNMVFYHDDLRAQVVEKMELQNSIIRAIEAPALENIGTQFEIYLQPKMEVLGITEDSMLVGAIAAEALIRWNHPEKGQLSPAQFIPLAEETGLIMPIGKWVLYRAAEILRSWQGTAMGEVKLSINLSPRQFKSDDIITVLKAILEKQFVDPQNLVLEVTETSVFDDPSHALEIMKDLQNLGVLLSVDDFGTGYSSLSYLHRFPLDEIKIDKSFLEHFPHDHQEEVIIASLVNIAAEMNLDIVAEGVETLEQVKVLYEMGCRMIQGYYFSKPMDVGTFENWVKNCLRSNKILPLMDGSESAADIS